MKATHELKRETPESLANMLQIIWDLGERHNDRMTRLPQNLRNLTNIIATSVFCALDNNTVRLGDHGITEHTGGIHFSCLRIRNFDSVDLREVPLSTTLSSQKEKINKLLGTDFSDSELDTFITTVSNRVIKKIEDKMIEA